MQRKNKAKMSHTNENEKWEKRISLFLPEKNLLGCAGQLAELVMTEEEVHQLWNVVETSEKYWYFTFYRWYWTIELSEKPNQHQVWKINEKHWH